MYTDRTSRYILFFNPFVTFKVNEVEHLKLLRICSYTSFLKGRKENGKKQPLISSYILGLKKRSSIGVRSYEKSFSHGKAYN